MPKKKPSVDEHLLDIYYKQLPEKLFPVSIRYGVIHIHAPKTAGTSIRQHLFGSGEIIRHVKAARVPRVLWEEMPSFSVVRHPITRFMSSYNFHVRSDYDGVLLKRNPDLKSLDPVAYADRFIGRHPLLAPQVKYLFRDDSDKKRVDHVVKFENLRTELSQLFGELGLPKRIPRVKVGPKELPDLSKPLLDRVIKHFEADFEAFDYTLEAA